MTAVAQDITSKPSSGVYLVSTGSPRVPQADRGNAPSIHPIGDIVEPMLARVEEETRYSSSVAAVTEHPVIATLRGVRRLAAPLVLKRLEENRDHGPWVLVLYGMYGTDSPVAPAAGDMAFARKSWLEWGKKTFR